MSERILEYVQGTPQGRIDPGKAAIYGVKILGEQSANPPPNNNSYPLEMRRASVRLFENSRVFVDHPGRGEGGQTRPYQDAMGLIRNVREAGDGLRGDWHFPPRHPLAENVLWDAEHAGHGLAFSINATAGKVRMDGDRKVIESLERVNSVDLVSRGATVKGLFESRRDTPRRPPAPLLPRPPVKLTGLFAARLRAIDAAIDQGRYSRSLRESIRNAASETALEQILERAGVAFVPRHVVDGRSLAAWASS
jgi:hypothetical protein